MAIDAGINDARSNDPSTAGLKNKSDGGCAAGAPGKRITQKRVQINLSERAYNRLEELKSKTDALSAADVVREALRVYEALVDEVNSGKTIVLEDPDKPNQKEIIRLI